MNVSKSKEVNYISDENMISTYNNMNNMRKQQLLCDLNMKIGSKIMAVHKIVLASNSEYFNKMFTSDFKESSENEITINEVEPEALEHLVEYAYTSKLKITEQNVQGLLVASNFLLFDRNIFTECLKFLKDIVNADNCFKFKNFAYLNNIDELQELCNSFILENFGELSISSQFLLLSFDQIFELIQSEHINASEVKIYESIMLWVKHDLNYRLNYLQKLMKCIRMSLIPASYFLNHIENEEILKANCKHLLYKTLKLYSSEHAKCNLSSSNMFCQRRRMCSNVQLILFACRNINTRKYTLNCMSTNDHEISDLFEKDCETILNCTFFHILSDGRVLCKSKTHHFNNLSYSKMYDGRIKEWVNIGDFNFSNIMYEESVELKKHLYVLGKSYNFISFNTTGNIFSPVQKQSTGWFGRLVTSDEFIYCVTGSRTSYCKVYEYNPNTDVWSLVSHTNFTLDAAFTSVCYLNGYIYILGGNELRSKMAWMFSISTRIMKRIADMNVCRGVAGAVAVNGLIYVIGGCECNNSIEIYDPQTNKWTLSKHKIKSSICSEFKPIILNPESNINSENISDYYSNL